MSSHLGFFIFTSLLNKKKGLSFILRREELGKGWSKDTSRHRTLAAERTLMIFFRTAGMWVPRDLLFVGVSPLLRGVLGGRFSSNNSGLR